MSGNYMTINLFPNFQPGTVLISKSWLKNIYYVVVSINQLELTAMLSVLHVEHKTPSAKFNRFDARPGESINMSLFNICNFDIVGEQQ